MDEAPVTKVTCGSTAPGKTTNFRSFPMTIRTSGERTIQKNSSGIFRDPDNGRLPGIPFPREVKGRLDGRRIPDSCKAQIFRTCKSRWYAGTRWNRRGTTGGCLGETAKANSPRVYKYLEYVLTELARHQNNTNRAFLADLLPWSESTQEKMSQPEKM